MAKRDDTDWMTLSLRTWQLGMDAVTVMGLRSARLWTGGALSEREANRMVREKLAAASDLGWAYARAMTPDPARAADIFLDTMAPKVTRNRRRLSR